LMVSYQILHLFSLISFKFVSIKYFILITPLSYDCYCFG
jgi:hypothetical protein